MPNPLLKISKHHLKAVKYIYKNNIPSTNNVHIFCCCWFFFFHQQFEFFLILRNKSLFETFIFIPIFKKA